MRQLKERSPETWQEIHAIEVMRCPRHNEKIVEWIVSTDLRVGEHYAIYRFGCGCEAKATTALSQRDCAEIQEQIRAKTLRARIESEVVQKEVT